MYLKFLKRGKGGLGACIQIVDNKELGFFFLKAT